MSEAAAAETTHRRARASPGPSSAESHAAAASATGPDSAPASERVGPSDRAALFARALERYESRPQQLAMAQAVGEALAGPHHLMVEAGTGVGKSFAYLLPVIEHVVAQRKRVVISTHTIALQEQLMEKDIPALGRVVPGRFKAVLVKGRHNYLGLRRLMQTSRRQGAMLVESREGEQLRRIEDWAYETREGSLSDLPFTPLPQLWQHVRSESNNCMGPRCETYEKCFYQRARRNAADADVLVVNHALFFSDLALRSRENVSFLPDYDAVIFDEAHTLEAVASDYFGVSVSSRTVEALLNGLFNERTGRGLLAMLECDPLRREVTAVRSKADALFAQIGLLATGNGTSRLRKPPRVENLLSPALHALAVKLREVKAQCPREDEQFELNSAADRCVESAEALEALLKQQLADCVYWLEASNGRDSGVSLRAAPTTVGPILREALFERVKSIVLTSATLSTGGEEGFEYLRDRLGVVEAQSLRLDSPFNYREQVTLHVEAGLPEPNDAAFLPAACEKIKTYLEMTGGRAFVLFTSYAALNQAEALLKDFCAANAMRLLVQGREMARSAMLAAFKADGRAVLLGTESFWQGVDVPGDALGNVIITKLPFSPPDQPLTAARVEAIEASGGNAFMEYQVPEAVLKLKQGFGRLIRTASDRGIVVILDKRVRTKHYGRKFLAALPACKVEVHP
ncbi:MAG: DEAD/DEAH box helicase [Planctomycetia bacterium]|nr:MAG: DEAD/DEAH box helicase [Planctomycetia bacterium]RIK71815.1 MAG: helicase [Planctomycetota bacterium]